MKRTTTPPSESFSFSDAPSYADKTEYIEKNLSFIVNAVELQPGRGFDGTDRWVIKVEPADGRGEQLITLSSNEKRDPLLHSAREHVTKHGSIRNVRLHKSGKAYYLHNDSQK